MARTDLGDKQVCPSCGAKFYDLRKRPATCPKCATVFDPSEEGVRVKRGRSRVTAHDPAYEDEEELEGAKAKKADGDEDEDEEAEETPEVDLLMTEPATDPPSPSPRSPKEPLLELFESVPPANGCEMPFPIFDNGSVVGA